MRTIFHYQKPLQKEFNNIHSTLKVLQNRPKEILSGIGTPSNLKGQEGSIYVNTDTKAILIKKNGQWK